MSLWQLNREKHKSVVSLTSKTKPYSSKNDNMWEWKLAYSDLASKIVA